MRYWDTSALVPLVATEPRSEEVRGWLAEDPDIVTGAGTPVEVASAIERRVREGSLGCRERRSILARVRVLAEAWDEVVGLSAVRTRALGLLARHDPRAADAARLAAALLAADPDPRSLPFVCLDDRLAVAAEREGLRVLDPA